MIITEKRYYTLRASIEKAKEAAEKAHSELTRARARHDWPKVSLIAGRLDWLVQEMAAVIREEKRFEEPSS